MYVTALGDAGVFQTDGGTPYVTTGGYAYKGGNVTAAFPSNAASLTPGAWLLAQTATNVDDAGATSLDGFVFESPDVASDCFYIDDLRIYRR